MKDLKKLKIVAWIVTAFMLVSGWAFVYTGESLLIAFGFILVGFCSCPLSSKIFKKIEEKIKIKAIIIQIVCLIISFFVVGGLIRIHNHFSTAEEPTTAEVITTEETTTELTTIIEETTTPEITTVKVTTAPPVTTTKKVTTTEATTTSTTITTTAPIETTVPVTTTISNKPISSLKFGKLLDANVSGSTLIIKAKIESSYSNHSTISQNFFNVEDVIINKNGHIYNEIQYWAVADMMDGSESKVVAFTINKEVINMIKDKKIPVNQLDKYATDVYILPSLLN